MTNGVETRLDGSTLVVRISMRFQRRGGRKRIVAPDGGEIAPTTKPQPDGILIKALARAWRCQRMLDEGVYATVSEIGDAENISKSYVSRILRLALLAPDLVEAILDPHQPWTPGLLETLHEQQPTWERQRAFYRMTASGPRDVEVGADAPADIDRPSHLSCLPVAPADALRPLSANETTLFATEPQSSAPGHIACE